MNVFKINTTAWSEEDFYLVTTLDEEDVVSVIKPIVMAERDGGDEYDNDMLLYHLKQKFPQDDIEMYNEFTEIYF